MWCLECGYSLHGLPECRCPECGQPFDPADATTFIAKLRSGGRYFAAAIVGGLAMGSPLVAAWLNDRFHFAERFDAVLAPLAGLGLALLLCGFAVECSVLGRSYQGLFRTPFRFTHRTTLWIAFAISGVLVIGSAGYMLVLSACRLMR